MSHSPSLSTAATTVSAVSTQPLPSRTPSLLLPPPYLHDMTPFNMLSFLLYRTHRPCQQQQQPPLPSQQLPGTQPLPSHTPSLLLPPPLPHDHPCCPHAPPSRPHAHPCRPHAQPCRPHAQPCRPHAHPCRPHAQPCRPHSPPRCCSCAPESFRQNHYKHPRYKHHHYKHHRYKYHWGRY
ncbi:unnamed protein product [Closterium sp. NIES-53]